MLKKIANGAALAVLLTAGAVSAQTTTATTSTTTPGVPNTGAGDVIMTAMVLGVSALVAVGGALYLWAQRRTEVE